MANSTIQVALMVGDYLAGNTVEGAFELASGDAQAARNRAREYLEDVVGATEARRIAVGEPVFLECDGANPTHAAAHFQVEIDAPDDLVDAVRAGFEDSGIAP